MVKLNGEICKLTNKKDSNVSNLLRKMITNNHVIKVNGSYEALIDEYDDTSQLHLSVNREKYPDNEGYRRALMDRITTEEMERIVKGNGDLNRHAYKTQ